MPAAPGLSVLHYWINDMDAAGNVVAAGAMDTPLAGMQRFHVYRIRFQILNSSDNPVAVRPTLEYGFGGSSAWLEVPEVAPKPNVPFYAAADNGKADKVRTEAISKSDLREKRSHEDAKAVGAAGELSAGRNPAPGIMVRAHQFTEVEFAIRATGDAPWESTWGFRLTLGKPLEAGIEAAVTLEPDPPVILSPGQRTGEVVAAPQGSYRLIPKTGIVVGATLAVARLTPEVVAPNAAGTFTTVHENYTLTDDRCAACHRGHSGQGAMLTKTTSNPVSTLCFICHNGTGATANVQTQYANVSLPANSASTASYYSHPATTAGTYISGSVLDFRGVLLRQSQCVDCHQPHNSSSALTTQTTSGWTVGGAIKGASGVKVTNGAANAAPTYTIQTRNTYEYELCLKCHSGYTTLLSQNASHPSWWALDKGVEFNPANTSYHPVEAQGKNQTSQLDLGLSESSPYKLWTFTTTSVIRCEHCHGNSALTAPASNAQIDNHTSLNRGILLRNYRDRVLKSTSALYSSSDFALCFLCHGEAPFLSTGGSTRTDTNFRYHGLHVAALTGKGTGGTDIDVAGAGQSNAICAECHFRIHGSSYPVGTQTLPGSRLVNFAPNVQSSGGVIRFVQRSGATPGTCTLLCHAENHSGYQY